MGVLLLLIIIAIASIQFAVIDSTRLTGAFIKPPNGSEITLCSDLVNGNIVRTDCADNFACKGLLERDGPNNSGNWYRNGDRWFGLHYDSCQYGRRGPDECGCFECQPTYEVSSGGGSCICEGEYYIPGGSGNDCVCSADAEQCPGLSAAGDVVCCTPTVTVGSFTFNGCVEPFGTGTGWACGPTGIIDPCPDGQRLDIDLAVCVCEMPDAIQCGSFDGLGGGWCCPHDKQCSSTPDCAECDGLYDDCEETCETTETGRDVEKCIDNTCRVELEVCEATCSSCVDPSSSSYSSIPDTPESSSASSEVESSSESSSEVSSEASSSESSDGSSDSSASVTVFDPQVCCQLSDHSCIVYDPFFPPLDVGCSGPQVHWPDMASCLTNCVASSSSSSADSSASVCPPCDPAPDPSCTGTGPCGCGPYICPESSSSASSDSSSSIVGYCCEQDFCNPSGDCENPIEDLKECLETCSLPSSMSSDIASSEESSEQSSSSSMYNACQDDCIEVTCCKDNLCKPNMTCLPQYLNSLALCETHCVECTNDCPVLPSSSSSSSSVSLVSSEVISSEAESSQKSSTESISSITSDATGGTSGGNSGGTTGGGNGDDDDDVFVDRCGDGVIQYGEQCERGSEYFCTTGKICDTNSCTCFDTQPQPYCGDGIFQPGEQCDKGIDQYCLKGRECNTDLCTCVPLSYESFCGNGLREGDEECDDGNLRNNDGCQSDCTIGEGFKGCIENSDCIAGACINGSCNPCFTHEECSGGICDNGECKLPVIVAGGALCGNGVLEFPEECDDGNTIDSDACSASCQLTINLCSNGVIDGEEECDDGNRINGDGCNRYCLREKAVENNVSLVASEEGAVSQPVSVLSSAINPHLLHQSAPQQLPFPQFPVVPTQQPVPYQLPLANLQPLIQTQGPVGDTGPATVAVIGAGAASGLAWMRRRRTK